MCAAASIFIEGRTAAGWAPLLETNRFTCKSIELRSRSKSEVSFHLVRTSNVGPLRQKLSFWLI